MLTNSENFPPFLSETFFLESCLSQSQGKQLVSEPDQKQTPLRETEEEATKARFLEFWFRRFNLPTPYTWTA